MILCLRKVLARCFFPLNLVDTCSTLKIIPLSTSKYLIPRKCICENGLQAKIRCNFNPPLPAVSYSTVSSPMFHNRQKVECSMNLESHRDLKNLNHIKSKCETPKDSHLCL